MHRTTTCEPSSGQNLGGDVARIFLGYFNAIVKAFFHACWNMACASYMTQELPAVSLGVHTFPSTSRGNKLHKFRPRCSWLADKVRQQSMRSSSVGKARRAAHGKLRRFRNPLLKRASGAEARLSVIVW